MISEWDRFTETYQLLPNHLVPDSPYEGTMFETFGDELEFVLSQPINNVWTLKDCDGELIVEQGLHFVDRLGYFIGTEEAPEKDLTFEY